MSKKIESISIEELLEDEELDKQTIENIVSKHEGKNLFLSKTKMKKHYQKIVYRDYKRMNMSKSKVVKMFKNLYNITRRQAYNLVKEFENESKK